MNTADLKKAFQLSASLIQHPSYYSMTYAFLDYLSRVEGVVEVASYEVFGDMDCSSHGAHCAHEFLIRRFPTSLGEAQRCGNVEMLADVLDAHDNGVHFLVEKSGPWTVMDVSKSVNPRRIVLVNGLISDYDTTLITGLFTVYASQVALLDQKERSQLTLLPNRYAFDMLLDELIAALQVQAKPTVEHLHQTQDTCSWLAMFAIDDFDALTKRLGGARSQQLLMQIADLLKKTLRYSDYIFDFDNGGFGIVLNQISFDGASMSLERVRRRIESFPLPKMVENCGPISASMGFADISAECLAEQVVSEAEKSLAMAQKQGGNTACCRRGLWDAVAVSDKVSDKVSALHR